MMLIELNGNRKNYDQIFVITNRLFIKLYQVQLNQVQVDFTTLISNIIILQYLLLLQTKYSSFVSEVQDNDEKNVYCREKEMNKRLISLLR